MTRIVETIREALSETAPPAGALKQAEERLIAVVEKDSLGALIASALAAKNQGRINEAISKVTKANRQQLTAVENITKTLDEAFDRPANEVIFAKYRQIAPFEMGVAGADDVLELVERFQKALLLADNSPVERLHELENERTDELKALAFFRERFSEGGAEADIEEAERRLNRVADDLERTRNAILSTVISTVCAFMAEHHIATISLPARYDVAGWLYQIATSKTLTKSADEVQTV